MRDFIVGERKTFQDIMFAFSIKGLLSIERKWLRKENDFSTARIGRVKMHISGAVATPETKTTKSSF